MGQVKSSSFRPQPPPECLAFDALVALGKVGGLGSLPMSCRYTTRPLEDSFKVESRVLGTGMSGPVRLATGLRDSKKYAVKSFKKKGMKSKDRASLKGEAEIYLSLDHPHVARLEMVHETNDKLHLVMEYLEGGELYERLSAQQLYTEAAAAEAARQMLLAVAYLHAHGIAHRDLKLENFLYEGKGTNHLKLIDFGFAKFVDQSETMSQACGSLHYVAPEVLARSYTSKADMWSMGVIVYMLLVGSPPCFGHDDDEIIRKVKSGQVHWGSRFQRLSPAARSFLKQLLVKDPDQRMSAQEALLHPWIIGQRGFEGPVAIDAGTLDGLRAFAKESRFRRGVLSMMAWSMTTADRLELRQQFLSIDKDNGGTISLLEFKDAICQRCNVSSSEAEEIFNSLDTDHNDEVEYSEFLAAAMLGHVKLHEDVLRRTFARVDSDGDERVDRTELLLALGDAFTGAEIEEILKEADTSGDGKLDFQDFFAYFYNSDPEVGARSTRRRRTEKLSLVIDELMEHEAQLLSGDDAEVRPAAAAESDKSMKDMPEGEADLPSILGSRKVTAMTGGWNVEERFLIAGA